MERGELIQRFMGIRTRLHGFIWSLVGDYHTAEDVFQEVSVVILENKEKYTQGTNFDAWAMEIARRTALHYRRKAAKSPLPVPAVENLRQSFASVGKDEYLEEMSDILRGCLEKVREVQRDLLVARYVKRRPMKWLADKFGGSVESVRSRIRRIREILFRCVKSTLSAGGV